MVQRHLARGIVKVVLVLLFCVDLGADETFVESAGGTVTVREPEETDVQLASQTIRLYLQQDGYIADVSFIFRNNGPEAVHQVGFPRYSQGTVASKEFQEFWTWVDDKPVDAERIPVTDGEIRAWYVKEVRFPGYSTTATRVRYRADYGRDRLLHTVEYFYGTGGSWSGPIGTIVLQVNNHDCMWVDSFAFDGNTDTVVVSLNRTDFEVHAVHLEPELGDRIRLAIEPVPWWLRTVPSEREKWFYSRFLLKEEYLRLLTLHQLALLRNTFFARRGFDFGAGSYGEFFQQFSWYSPRYQFTEDVLNAIELENVKTVQAEENRRRTILLE